MRVRSTAWKSRRGENESEKGRKMREEKQALAIVRSRDRLHWSRRKKKSRKKTHPSAATCPFALGAETVLTTTVSCCSFWCCCCCCCFRETKKVVSHKRAADGKAKRLPDIFSLTSRRCRSSRRPPVLAPAVSSSVAAVPSRSSSAAVASAIAAANVTSPALLGGSGLRSLFFCLALFVLVR